MLIFSDSMEEHLSHIKEVMKALKKAGLKVKPTKCPWGARQLEYLGPPICNGQVAVPEHQDSSHDGVQTTSDKRDMIYFLGTIGYYRRFIKCFSTY